MIGLRGLPATYGGIERHVEEIGARLVDRGHQVVVYGRPAYTTVGMREHRGIWLVDLPSPKRKGAEAFVHSALASFSTIGGGFDVAHFHALGPGLFTPLSKALTGAAVVQTIHGRDDERAKWGGVAQRLLRFGGWLSARVPDEVVVVSEDLVRYYRDLHGRAVTQIPNGVPKPASVDPALLEEALGLAPQSYLLFLGRLVPEKNPLLLVEAFRDVQTSLSLVIVGDSSHTDDYVEQLRQLARQDDRVRLVGYQYGETLTALLQHAALFVQPSDLEGLPLTLLEAAAYGLPVVASDIPPHMEVIRRPAPGKQVFRAGDRRCLSAQLHEAIASPEALLDGAEELHNDVVVRYDWDRATDELEQVYQRALKTAAHSGSGRLARAGVRTRRG